MTRGEYKIVRDEEYMEYIEEHVKNVITSFEMLETMDASDIPWLEAAIEKLHMLDRIEEHDSSKYSDFEFGAYRKKFYPIDEEDKLDAEEEFEQAWKHHCKHNPHHWEYWVDQNGNPIDMDDISIVEMISDWAGMSLKFNNDATACKSWFVNQDDIKLTAATLYKVNQLLDFFCK